MTRLVIVLTSSTEVTDLGISVGAYCRRFPIRIFSTTKMVGSESSSNPDFLTTEGTEKRNLLPVSELARISHRVPKRRVAKSALARFH